MARGIASALALERQIWLPSPPNVDMLCIAFEIGSDGYSLAIITAISIIAAIQKAILQNTNTSEEELTRKILSPVDSITAPSWTLSRGFGGVIEMWILAVANSKLGISMSKAGPITLRSGSSFA